MLKVYPGNIDLKKAVVKKVLDSKGIAEVRDLANITTAEKAGSFRAPDDYPNIDKDDIKAGLEAIIGDKPENLISIDSASSALYVLKMYPNNSNLKDAVVKNILHSKGISQADDLANISTAEGVLEAPDDYPNINKDNIKAGLKAIIGDKPENLIKKDSSKELKVLLNELYKGNDLIKQAGLASSIYAVTREATTGNYGILSAYSRFHEIWPEGNETKSDIILRAIDEFEDSYPRLWHDLLSLFPRSIANSLDSVTRPSDATLLLSISLLFIVLAILGIVRLFCTRVQSAEHPQTNPPSGEQHVSQTDPQTGSQTDSQNAQPGNSQVTDFEALKNKLLIETKELIPAGSVWIPIWENVEDNECAMMTWLRTLELWICQIHVFGSEPQGRDLKDVIVKKKLWYH